MVSVLRKMIFIVYKADSLLDFDIVFFIVETENADVPFVFLIRFMISLMVVLFPAPFGPIKPII